MAAQRLEPLALAVPAAASKARPVRRAKRRARKLPATTLQAKTTAASSLSKKHRFGGGFLQSLWFKFGAVLLLGGLAIHYGGGTAVMEKLNRLADDEVLAALQQQGIRGVTLPVQEPD